MPRVVPSQILRVTYGASSQEHWDEDGYQVDPQFSPSVSALIRLVDELPTDLVTLNGDDYNTFVKSIELLRTALRCGRGT